MENEHFDPKDMEVWFRWCSWFNWGDLVISRGSFSGVYRWASSVKPQGFIESFDGRENKGNLTMAESVVLAWHPWSLKRRGKKREKIYIYIWVSLTKHTKKSHVQPVFWMHRKKQQNNFSSSRDLVRFKRDPLCLYLPQHVWGSGSMTLMAVEILTTTKWPNWCRRGGSTISKGCQV